MDKKDGPTLKAEGLALFQRGDYAAALTTFEAAASAFAAGGERGEQAEMLNNMGIILRVKRRREEAVAALQEAQAIFAELGDNGRGGQALANLGDVYADMGQKAEAARSYSGAASLLAQAGDRQKQAEALRALSLLELRRGGWLAAMMRMDESLTVRPSLTVGQRLLKLLLRFALGLLGRG